MEKYHTLSRYRITLVPTTSDISPYGLDNVIIQFSKKWIGLRFDQVTRHVLYCTFTQCHMTAW